MMCPPWIVIRFILPLKARSHRTDNRPQTVHRQSKPPVKWIRTFNESNALQRQSGAIATASARVGERCFGINALSARDHLK